MTSTVLGSIEAGTQPVATSSVPVMVTVPLRLSLSDIPSDQVIPYGGGIQAVDFVLAKYGLGPNPTVERLQGALGDATLTYRITSFSLDGGVASDFIASPGDCIGATGESCRAGPFAFRPAAVGPREDVARASVGEVHITGGGWVGAFADLIAPFFVPFINSFLAVALHGTGSPITVTTPVLDFGSHPSGSVSPSLALGLTNVSPDPVDLVSVSVEGPLGAEFTLTANPCAGTQLAPGATCTVALDFRPSAGGTREAEVHIAHDGPGSPSIVRLAGVGLAPVVSLDVPSMSFGEVPAGATSAAQLLSVTNTGHAALLVSAVATIGPAAGNFVVVDETCTAGPVPVGGSCFVAVSFAPQRIGVASASLSLIDNADDSPQSVALSATGMPAAALSVALATGAATVQSGAQVVYTATVHNAGPSAAVEAALSLELPPGATFVSADRPCITPPVGATGTVLCPLGNLAAGATSVLTVAATASASIGSILAARARIRSGTPDVDDRNDGAEVHTEVVA